MDGVERNHLSFARKINRELKSVRLGKKSSLSDDDSDESENASSEAPRKGFDPKIAEAQAIAAVTVGGYMAQLTPEARAAFEAQTANMDLLTKAKVIELHQTLTKPNGQTQPNGATLDLKQTLQPPDRGAGPARTLPLNYPRSKTGFAKLADSERASLMSDQNFHLDELPHFDPA